MSDQKHGWSQPLPVTTEALNKSAQAQRDQVIDNYTNILNDLESKIKIACVQLDTLKKDMDGIHKLRQAEYTMKEQALNEQHAINDQERASIEAQHNLYTKRNDAFNAAIFQEDERVKSHTIAFLAKQDQLTALAEELKLQKQALDKRAEDMAIIDAEHLRRSIELDEATNSTNQVIQKTLDDHHALKAEKEAHQSNVDVYTVLLAELHAAQKKNEEFYYALQDQEKALEPLKKQYEDGIEVNRQESSSLRDSNIQSYQLKTEADKRIQLAIEAEQRAKAEIEKLETLKVDIHNNIKKET